LNSQDISKRYGSLEALHRVNLFWERGKITSILGPSGSGKTTLGEVFVGLVRPDEGKILAGGEDITSWRPDRRRISLLPQEWELFPHLTALENVSFGLWASGVAKNARDERARSLLFTVGLADREQSFPQELSGGQQQRVALARALAAPSPFVVLDEPFSSVDQDTRGLLRELLMAESRQGRGILLITHDRSDALVLSQTIHCLISGQLIMSGSPKQVYSEPVSLQAALLTGAAFLVPLSNAQELVNASSETSRTIHRAPIPLRPSHSSTQVEFGRKAFAVARPEWLQVANNEDFHLLGWVSSSSYSGAYYVVTLKGDSNGRYQIYLVSVAKPVSYCCAKV
jgi:ABC-type Fe3+/spermidine/putrescine transport system ATPase subunit